MSEHTTQATETSPATTSAPPVTTAALAAEAPATAMLVGLMPRSFAGGGEVHLPRLRHLASSQRPQAVLALQRTVGNATVGRLLRGGPGRMAGRAPLPLGSPRPLQRTCACGGKAGTDGVCEACRVGRSAPSRDRAAAGSWPNVATRSSALQRATDDPKRELVIAIAKRMGGHPVATALVSCVIGSNPMATSALVIYRLLRLAGALVTAPAARVEALMLEMISGLPNASHFCDCIPPHIIGNYARGKLLAYPDALANFDHYLRGGGAARAIDVARLVSSDAGAKRMIEQGINQQSEMAGELRDAVVQGGYAGKNWEYALGNVDLFRYQIADDEAARAENARLNDGTARVRLEIADPYEWHPDEFRPTVPCLHGALENLKASGAADFMVVGAADVRLKLVSARLPLPEASPETSPPESTGGP